MSLTKATFSMIAGQVGNVLDYGADPTGVADSSSAIQAAVNANAAVFVPSGAYKLASTVTLNTGNVLYGEGATSVLNCVTADTDVLYATGKNNIEVSNLKLTGVLSTDPAASNGVQFSGCTDCVVDSIEVEGVSNNGVIATAGSLRIRVSNSYFHDFTGAIQDSSGIAFYNDANNCIAENNVCTNGTWHGIRCQLTSVHHIIKNNYVAGTLAYGILAGYESVDANTQGVVDGNIVIDIEGSVLIDGDKRAGAGIYSQSVYGLKVVNNTLARCNKQTVTEVLIPAAIGVSGRVIVANNLIYDTYWYGIGIFSEDKGSVVSNNIVKDSKKTAIYCKNGTNAVVVNNYVSFEDEVPNRGILVTSQTATFNKAIIADNTIVNGSESIAIINGARCTVTGNLVENATGRGINLETVSVASVTGNTVIGATSEAFKISNGDSVQVTGNTFKSNGTYSIISQGTLADVNINNNVQTPYVVALADGSFLSFQYDDVPSSGTWSRGCIVYDRTPSASGSIGWVCTASGTPGTWKTFGTIAA